MAKVRRKIILIDEEKCNGCGLCIPSCPEGALRIVQTPGGPKAKLVKESFCDGLGACLGECPREALKIEEKEVDEYGEESVIARIKEKSPQLLEEHLTHLKGHAGEFPAHHSHPKMTSCPFKVNFQGEPSAQVMSWEGRSMVNVSATADLPQARQRSTIPSELRQWPVQLKLVPPDAPYFRNADLVLAADCVPFAYANFHQDFLKGKALAIGCPKLDDFDAYLEKVAEIVKTANPKSITVVHMEVPCCSGLVQIAKEAIKKSGKNIPLESVTISIKGEILGTKE